MDTATAYKAVSKHTFIAHPDHADRAVQVIVFANNKDEAKRLASEFFMTGSVTVYGLEPTGNPQIYK